MKLRHWKTRWKLLLALVVLIGAYFAYSTISHLYYEHQLAAYLAELDAREPGWSWEDRFARLPSLKPEDNAAMELRAIMRLLTLDEQQNLLGRNEWNALFRLYENSPRSEANRIFLRDNPQAAIPKLTRDSLIALLAGVPCPQALMRARDLKRFPGHQFEHKYRPILWMTLLPDVQCLRNLGTLLSWSCAINLELNNPRLAAEDISAILQVVRVYNNDPFFISSFSRSAILQMATHSCHRLLAQLPNPSPALLLSLQTEFLDDEKHMPTMVELLSWHCAINDHDLKLLHNGEYSISGMLETIQSSFPRNTVITGWSWLDKNLSKVFPQSCLGFWGQPRQYACERLDNFRYTDRLIACANKPEHEWLPAIRQLTEQGIRPSPFLHQLVQGSNSYQQYLKEANSPIERVMRVMLVSRAHIRTMVAVLAAERYRLAKGSWPTSWEQLSPDFLASIPLDPFTGKPLILKPMPDGLMIYSVGWNGTDENGAIFPVDRQTYGDIGYRLWNPSERRQDMSKAIEENTKK